MFRLTKVLNLKEDVLQKLPDTSSNISTNNAVSPHSGEQHDKAYLRHKRVVVGKEKDGTLLISRIIYERDSSKTCVDLYDFKARELKTIYTHPSQISVVGSTINEDKSLLGFTVRTDVPSEVDMYSYISYIVELATGICHVIDPSSPHPQRLHFLHGIGEKACVYLLICSQECSVLQVSTKTSSTGVVTINKLKKTVISKRNTMWYEYDPARLHLHLLNKSTTKSSPEEHMFKFFNFTVNRFSYIYEIPLNITLPLPNKLDLLYPFPYTLGAVQPIMPHLHVVRMAGNAVCLCQQHELDSLCIKVSIFVLHLRQRLDFWIPMNNIEGGWAVVCRTRVLFDCIENMLLVYIPGYFLQLVDCGEEHYPCINMTINDREYSSPLPEDSQVKLPSPGVQASTVVPFSLRSEDGRLTMLDTHSGIIYEYTFDRGTLLRVFDEDSTRLHIQTLHLACIHMQDSELVDQIIIHMCAHNPQALTVELMKEFLLGTPYQEMKALAMEPLLLQLLPITSSEILDTTQLKKQALYNASITTFYGYSNIPGTKTMIGNKEEEWKRRKYPQDKTGNRGGVERAASKESLTVSQFLKSMFSIGSGDETPVPRIASGGADMDIEDGVEECCTLPYANFVENLTDYWAAQLPNSSRSRLMQWAQNYRDAQMVQVRRLYDHIYKSTTQASGEDMYYNNNSGTLFQLLERLYTAVEELAFPFPRGFHTNFASLGFKCLPRGAFLQFVERGIITLTTTFLRELLVMPIEDWDFKFQLLLRLRDSNKAIELIQQTEYAPPHLLVEGAISLLPVMQYMVMPADGEKNDMPTQFYDMEMYSNSSFIPLSSLLAFVNRTSPPISPASSNSSIPSSLSQSQENISTFVNTSCAKMLQSFSYIR